MTQGASHAAAPVDPQRLGAAVRRVAAAVGLELRHWADESTGVAYLARAGTTHLISSEAAALLELVAGHERGLEVREIAHAAGLGGSAEPELFESLERIIAGLIDSGLLRRRIDDGQPGRVGGG